MIKKWSSSGGSGSSSSSSSSSKWMIAMIGVMGLYWIIKIGGKAIAEYEWQQKIYFYKNSRRFVSMINNNKNKNKNNNNKDKKIENTNKENKDENKDEEKEKINKNILRVMTYNILAAGPYYLNNKEYCPLKYRIWKYRIQNLLAEIHAYNPDIICLQEVTQFMYDASLYSSSNWDPKLSLKYQLDKMGYTSIFSLGVREEYDLRKRDMNHAQADCIAYRTQSFILLHSYILPLNILLDPLKNKGLIDERILQEEFGMMDKSTILQDSLFYKAYLHSPDLAIVLHLKHKDTQKEMIACTSHFHYNPVHPHIKSLQCYVLSLSLHRLMIDKWNLDPAKVPIVIGLDANAVPIKSIPDIYDPELPEGGMRSGQYELFSQGKLSYNHFDHPYTRIIKEINEVSKKLEQDEKLNKKKDLKDIEKEWFVKYCRHMDKTPYLHLLRGGYLEKEKAILPIIKKDWYMPILWKSLYCIINEPIHTHKTNDFCGTLDYLFITNGFQLLSYLEMPWQRNLNYHHQFTSKHKHTIQIDDAQKQKEIEQEELLANTFAPIPSAKYSSDHLSLVADIAFV